MSSGSNTPNLVPHLPGYTLIEELYSGSRTLVHRALEESSQRLVITKLLLNNYPSFAELVQFRNQYTITKDLCIPGIVRPNRLEAYGNSYALIMDDLGGVSLQQYYQSQPVSLIEWMSIALQISEILQDLYTHRIIHKDIKPANLLIQPESKQIKLIDFSIASLLPKETEEIKHPNVLEGTLAYLAPEQTGRMNRGIDYRTDFYSLGVTLFELLTGRLPFESNDPLELVHCHIARPTPDPCEFRPEIPLSIAQIILKLMSKNAEDRYQSASGLKHDLETCLEQWKETGTIEPFEIGQRDICDRFTIPEKLYGRESEVKTLLKAFERVSQGNAEMLLVAGFSGIGKTAVVNEVHKPMTQQRGYFIKGKFDQFNRNIPLSAFVQAFRDLVRQLLSESDSAIELWRTSIQSALGENAQVMLEVIPDLVQMIGVQMDVPELTGSAAENRFNLVFQQFVQVFTHVDHPLILFLDDLQWADSASLKLLDLLMQQSKHLLVIGAYRDNEVSATHPLTPTIEKITQADGIVNVITLSALTSAELNQLVADTLCCETMIAQPLTELVFQKTQGNPFFSTQFLKALYQDQHITFDQTHSCWQCDIAQVRSLSLTDDVVEFMADQLRKLPVQTQEVLQLAACVGAQFDLQTLAIVAQKTQAETATDLWSSLQEGLLLPIHENYKFFQSAEAPEQAIAVPYKFLHDRIQQAAYSLISDQQKAETHLKIGRLLLDQSEEKLFAIVSQFNLGLERVETQAERDQIAQLNLKAARKARLSAAYTASAQYCETALQLVPEAWTQQPEFALELYIEATNAAYLIGEYGQVDHRIQIICQHTTDPLEQVKAIDIQIQSLIARSQLSEAIQVGRNVLQALGVTLPEQPTSEQLAPLLATIRQQLAEIEHIADLPLMQDRTKLAAMNILSSMSSAAYIGDPALYPLIAPKQIELSLAFGNAIETPYAYSTYGLILCAFEGDIVGGNRAAEIAIALMEKVQASRFQAKVVNLVYPFVRIWQASLTDALEPLNEGYQAGLESGDLEFAAYCAYNRCKLAYAAGNDLSQLRTEMQQYGEAIAQLSQTTALNFHQIGQQAVLNWLGEAEQPEILTGEVYDESVRVAQHQATGDVYSIGTFYAHKLILTYHFGTPEAAKEIAQLGESAISGIIGTAFYSRFFFYDALTQLANGESNVERDLDRLDHWASHAPMNFTHQCTLIRAEQQRVLGNRLDAIELYDQAILAAKDHSQDKALANELAAKFYLAWGKENIAAPYMQEAYYCYARWGAKAKTDALETSYPRLLRPILQSAPGSISIFDKLTTLHTSNHRTQTNSGTSSSSCFNQTLDFSALLKVSESLASTIELDELLRKLTRTMLEQSGADHCVIVLVDHGKWQVRVTADLSQILLGSTPLEAHADSPMKLIQYVKNTVTIVVLDSLKTDLPVVGRYLTQHQPKSVLGLPILKQGTLVGVLYLDNRSTNGVFSHDRIQILNFLANQAAIALENARLYHQVQSTLSELQQAQLQMIQNEKMAALGSLVAGVAHEINNPVGCIVGNVGAARNYINDLLGLIDLYHEEFPEPGAKIEDERETIDLDYVRQDLPKLIQAMEDGGERIRSISKSLRVFSRADTDRKQRFNLHEGIDSTILILRHRLKANSEHSEIKIISNYGEIPQVECFPGQLNQVFMNLLANAIDAIEDSHPAQPRITIQTRRVEGEVEVTIADNGSGIPEDVRARIFDHLFTTKAAGRGTGLGLAIAQQIIVEKHGGRIEVESELGQGTQFHVRLPL